MRISFERMAVIVISFVLTSGCSRQPTITFESIPTFRINNLSDVRVIVNIIGNDFYALLPLCEILGNEFNSVKGTGDINLVCTSKIDMTANERNQIDRAMKYESYGNINIYFNKEYWSSCSVIKYDEGRLATYITYDCRSN